MILLSSNNANSTLAAGITSGQTSIQLAAGTGALFPSPGLNQYFPVTFNDVLTGLIYEIAWCTSRASDTLTVIRGQEGTTARAWLLGDYAYNANTAGNIQTGRAFSSVNNPTLPFTIPSTHNGVSQICSATGTITLPAIGAVASDFLQTIVCGSAGATITINPNSATVVLPTGATSSNFTISGLDTYITLQANSGTSQWNVISASYNLYNNGFLLAANNLSDVSNATTARSNLGAAALGGSSSQPFLVANGGSGNQAVNAGQFPSSLGTNGWKKYPDPNSPSGYFIEQWSTTNTGSFAANGGGGQQNLTATWPIAFPNAVRSAGLLSTWPSSINIGVYACLTVPTVSGVGVAINNTYSVAQNIYATVFAKGY